MNKDKKYYEEQIKYYEGENFFDQPEFNWSNLTFEEKCKLIDRYEDWEEENNNGII